MLLPIEVLVRRLGLAGQRVAQALAAVPGVHGAVAPDLRRSGGAPERRWSMRSRRRRLDAHRPRARSNACSTAAHAAGPDVQRRRASAPQNKDFIEAVYGNFPLMIALIAVITFVLLARAFRSLLLPLKAVILNVISVAAAWGVLELVWQNGPRLEPDLGDRGDGLDHRRGSR